MVSVDIYKVRLEADAARLDSLYEILAPPERERATRFRFAEHRRRFIVCRGTLREILSRYLELHPARIAFAYNRHGKPSLRDSRRGSDGRFSEIHFNVSHSGSWALQAVTRAGEVGIDIERIDPRFYNAGFVDEQIPERFFSPREVAQLRALPADQQTAAFFRCWTRKEAYIKARGLGLALPLDSFDVSLGPDDPPALLRCAGGWSVQDLAGQDFNVPPGYAAAVVAEGPVFSVAACHLPEAAALLPA
jgi:4'-phosphopantetheinyl transferase